ncbi:MAG: hypothetical protein HY318_14135 [Armatimonadetes bacterium]|nr:hypothetical protein [Armatimonadota bacterium]
MIEDAGSTHLGEARLHGLSSGVAPLVAYAVLYGSFAVGATKSPGPPNLGFLLFSTIVGALVAIYLVYSFSGLTSDWRRLFGLVVIGGAVDVAGNFLPGYLRTVGVAGRVLTPALIGLANLGLLTVAVGCGGLLAKGLRQASYLFLAALVSAIADTYSVFAGPTKHLVETEAVYYLTYQWGLISRGGIVPTIGVGDFVFLTLYFVGVRKQGWDDRKTLAAMALSFILGFLALLLRKQGLPALPFMAAGLLAAHARDAHLPPQEWRRIIGLALLFAALMTLIVLKRVFL